MKKKIKFQEKSKKKMWTTLFSSNKDLSLYVCEAHSTHCVDFFCLCNEENNFSILSFFSVSAISVAIFISI